MRTALQLNASASDGGAARAAVRVHEGLWEEGQAFGWTSRFQATSGPASGPGVCVGSPLQRSAIGRRLHPRLTQWRKRHWRTNNPALHSLAWPDTGLGAELIEAHSRGDFELLNLHWLGDSTLSIEEIGRLLVLCCGPCMINGRFPGPSTTPRCRAPVRISPRWNGSHLPMRGDRS